MKESEREEDGEMGWEICDQMGVQSARFSAEISGPLSIKVQSRKQ